MSSKINILSFFNTLVFFVLVFGLLQLGLSMSRGNDNCPLMAGHSEAICKLNPLEHIKEWQNMFTTLPTREIALIFLISILLVVFKKLTFWVKQKLIESVSFFSYNLQLPNKKIPKSFLQNAYSQGILNTKAF